MKRGRSAVFIIAAGIVLCGFQKPPAAQGTDSPKGAKAAQRETDTSQQSTQHRDPGQNKTNTEASGARGDNPSTVIVESLPEKTADPIERGISIIGLVGTVALAGVGFWGICVALDTLRQIKGQRRAMLGQLRAMRKQLDEMEKAAAMTISKERARLIIHKPTKNVWAALEVIEEGFPYWNLKLIVTHHGPTDAFNVRGAGTIRIIPDIRLPKEVRIKDRGELKIDNYVRSETGAIAVYVFTTIEPDIAKDIDQGELFLHVYGDIIYEDTFGQERKTPFYYVWRVEAFQPDDEIPNWEFVGNWTFGGDPEDNRAT